MNEIIISIIMQSAFCIYMGYLWEILKIVLGSE